MRKMAFAALIAVATILSAATGPALAGPNGIYVVTGVKEDDMLKMREGPGIGYRILLGLPNGTQVRVHRCEQSGSVRWCEVSLKQARVVKGYVSASYLSDL